MVRQGAKVVVSSRKTHVCQEVADGINAEAIVIPAHVGQREALQHLVDETRERLGQIDVLVCNAAVNPFYGSMQELPDDALDKIIDIQSLAGEHVVAGMIERKDGSIIIVSSVGGLCGSPVVGAYCMSKAADLQLVRNLAVENGRHNVRVNGISPGLVRTDLLGHFGEARIFCASVLPAIR